MGILDNVLKLFVGDKSKKDISEIQPMVALIKNQEAEIASLTIDELRSKTVEFKNKIKADQKEIQDQIDALELKSLEIEDINKKEDLYKEIDTLKDERYAIEVKTLENILPEAFAVMKETAKRFKDNETLTVNATSFDREISATNDYVTLEGEKAIWKNSWDAA